jgi:hypothetical protein
MNLNPHLLITTAALTLLATGFSATDLNADDVIDERGNKLGTFAGLEPATAINGETVGAVTTITATGYILQIAGDGEIGLLTPTWFAGEGCSGDEYLPPFGNGGNAPPLSGTVYRSMASGQLRYIERFAKPSTVKLKSRMLFAEDKALNCETMDGALLAFTTNENDPATTGYKDRFEATAAIAIRPGSASARPDKKDSSILNALRSSGTPEMTGSDLPQVFECSPGCGTQNLGDGACNMLCYNDACGFDGGDCNDKPQDEIETELAKFCAPGCSISDLEDGFCDQSCNVSECEYDRGDCQ